MLRKMARRKNCRMSAGATAALGVGLSVLLCQSALAGVLFNPPKGGAPKQTRGGASRNGDLVCIQSAMDSMKQLVLLSPTDSNYGLTVAARPSMFVYLPATTARKALFSVKDESGKSVHQSVVAIPASGGIVQVALPSKAPSLELNKNYVWGLAVLCGDQLKPGSPFVSSWIRRVAPPTTLATAMQKSPSLEQAALYGFNGIWYDTLTTLADLKQQKPNDATLDSTWKELLKSVGLERVAAKPIAGQVVF
jgi:Domain of Unknown Function (DUF928)